MSIGPEFAQAVAEGDELMTRIMLSNLMTSDPSFREFDESLAYARKSMPDLIEPHDGEVLKNDVTAWTKDYLNEQRSVVVNNFSQERIDLLRKMYAHIYSEKVERINREAFVREKQAEREAPTQKQVGKATVAVGAAVTVVGVAASSTALAVVGVGAAAVGVALIATDSK